MIKISYKQLILCQLKMTEHKKMKQDYMVKKTNGKE